MNAQFFEPREFADVARESIGGVMGSPINDFFENNSILELIEPYPEKTALHYFLAWLAAVSLDEATTETEPVIMPPAGRQRKPRLALLPIEEAFKFYGINGGVFQEFLADKAPEDADADDVYEFSQEMTLTGWTEEVAEKIANESFKILFEDVNFLSSFHEEMAERLRAVEWTELEAHHALFFENPGVLRTVRPSQSVIQAVLERDRHHCDACANIAQDSTNKPEQIVPGGLNDSTNLFFKCRSTSRDA